ncbi:META domain-containing protein [Robiginitomaculum antarcticum]|uniref:META domain-containing protein n=1 Tax=Robiginitomaculum antarcticum TaxID=437507 RepID=UPI00036020BF|nr:META domain-containing protein [Robiginitomaculum antarcticum]
MKHSFLVPAIALGLALSACSPSQSGENKSDENTAQQERDIVGKRSVDGDIAVTDAPAQPEFLSYDYQPGQVEVQALVTGTLTVENGCFVLNMGDHKLMPRMPAGVTRWDAETGSAIFAGRVYPPGVPIITNGGYGTFSPERMNPDDLGIAEKCILPDTVFMGTQLDDSYYARDLARSDPGLLEQIEGDWVIEKIDGKNPKFKSIISYHIKFDKDGVISGYDGCNRFSTTYNLLSGIAHFGSFMSSTAGCHGDPAVISNAVMALIRNGNRYARLGDTVHVTSGETQYVLSKNPAPTVQAQ